MEPDWDQLSIDTPELVDIEMPVAGIGSRFAALLVDYLIWAAVFILFIIIVSVLDPSLSSLSNISRKWGIAIFIFVPFVFYWGYFTLFEAFWNGRTPGKRIAKIRVIQRSGRGIGLFESMTRNLLRIVDQFPGVYAVGVIAIFCTRQHQRLGDLAAGTLVIHERENLVAASPQTASRSITAGIFSPSPATTFGLADFDVATHNLQKLGAQDLEVMESFFARRLDFPPETRAALAARIAAAIYLKSGLTAPAGVGVEIYLEAVARQLRDIARLQ